MEKKPLKWSEIKELYPNDYVGLTEIIRDLDNSIVSAVVLCSTKDTEYEEMVLMAVEGKIYMIYPNADASSKSGIIE